MGAGERFFLPHAPEADALVYEVSATGEATGNIPEIDDDEIDE